MVRCAECEIEMEDRDEVVTGIRFFVCPICGDDRYVDEGEDDYFLIEQDELEL